jgi:uncharacterized membrane protein YfcA
LRSPSPVCTAPATYTYKGRTELVAAMIMLVGAAMGAQVGAVATKYIKGYGIRIAFGLAVIGCALSILMKLVQPWVPQFKAALDIGSTVLVLGLVFLHVAVHLHQDGPGCERRIAPQAAECLTRRMHKEN